MPTPHSSLLIAALVGVLTLGASACKRPSAEATSEERNAGKAGATPIAAKFAKVESKSLPRRLEVSGTLDPDEQSEIAAQISAPVLSVNVDIGSRVKKGDVLVELDGREASLKLQSASATAASQKARLGLKAGEKFDAESVADVRASREARDLAVLEHDRAKALLDAGVLSKSAFDQAKSARDRAESTYESTRNAAERDYAALMSSQSQAGLSSKSLDDTKIRAPFDGSVVEKRISPGEYVGPGAVVVVLVRDHPLRFKFDVPESDVAAITIGGSVTLSVAAFPDRVFKAEVKRVGASVKTQTRTLPVEAEVPNEDLALRPGFFAKGWVDLAGSPQSSLFVPKSAVQPASNGHRVFVKKGDRVTERLVVAVLSEGEQTEVKGQIQEGDEVAIDHLTELADGALVAP